MAETPKNTKSIKNGSKSKLKLSLTILGSILVVFSIITVFSIPLIQDHNAKEAKNIVSKLKSLIPETTAGAYDDRINTTMPSVELNGENFSGILEIPILSVSLPVCSTWDKSSLSHFPHRYKGSVYDGSLIVGGSGNVGQFDFMKTISIGFDVFLTDMTGACYSFTVSHISIKKEISDDDLKASDGLILFAKNPINSEYTIVFCEKH